MVPILQKLSCIFKRLGIFYKKLLKGGYGMFRGRRWKGSFGSVKGQNAGFVKLAVLLSLAVFLVFLIFTVGVQQTKAADCDCGFCHGDNHHGDDWTGCSGCHDSPPQTGTHLVHYNSPSLNSVRYGGTTVSSTADVYKFDCGNCHPLDKINHNNGTVDIELYNPAAPAGSIKALNPSNAAYTPGGTVVTYANKVSSGRSLSYSDGTCNNVYCHSGYTVTSGAVGYPAGCAARTLPYASQTANFTVGSVITGATSGAIGKIISDKDAGTTGSLNVELTSGSFVYNELVTDSGGGSATLGSPGDCTELTYASYTVNFSRVYKVTPAWGTNSDALHSTFSTCTECHAFPLTTSYPSVDAGVGDSHQWIDPYGYGNLHAYNMGFDPIVCKTCHYNTVTQANTWSANPMDVTTYGVVPIASRQHHVTGTPDVTFDTGPEAINYYINAANSNLAGATYDPATMTCFNVACHQNQTRVTWGSPYRYYGPSSECNQCHNYH